MRQKTVAMGSVRVGRKFKAMACGFQSVFLKGPLDFHAGSHPHGWPTRQSPTQHFCFQNKKVHKYMLIVKIKIRQII